MDGSKPLMNGAAAAPTAPAPAPAPALTAAAAAAAAAAAEEREREEAAAITVQSVQRGRVARRGFADRKAGAYTRPPFSST